jgi:transposase InsO family protein
MDKNEIIRKVYYDPAGHGSINYTLKDAKAIDKTITYNDVKEWMRKNVENKRNLKGYNSFVANAPYEEFQTDIGFFKDLKDPEYKAGLFIIDIFTKYATVIPLKTNTWPDVLEALKKGFQKMEGKPQVIYSDQEGAWTNREVQNYLENEHIKLITTLNHAHIVERLIRTLKNMIYKRIEAAEQNEGKVVRWIDVLYPVLLTYNRRMVHSATKMTPYEAMQDKNHLDVLVNLILASNYTRKYPPVKVGDKVRVFKKRRDFAKERVSIWEPDDRTVEEITHFNNQPFYKVDGKHHQYSRSEILLIH